MDKQTAAITPPQQDHGRDNALAHLQEIEDWYGAWRFCQEQIEGRDMPVSAKRVLREHGFPSYPLPDVEEAIREEARESALSVELRSGWKVGGKPLEEEEMKITLTCGGPGLRLLADVDDGSASRPRLQYHDWGTGWTELILQGDQREALDWFLGLFSY